jgi:hypothetical protein
MPVNQPVAARFPPQRELSRRILVVPRRRRPWTRTNRSRQLAEQQHKAMKKQQEIKKRDWRQNAQNPDAEYQQQQGALARPRQRN